MKLLSARLFGTGTQMYQHIRMTVTGSVASGAIYRHQIWENRQNMQTYGTIGSGRSAQKQNVNSRTYQWQVIGAGPISDRLSMLGRSIAGDSKMITRRWSTYGRSGSDRFVADQFKVVGSCAFSSKWSAHDRSVSSDRWMTDWPVVIGTWPISSHWSAYDQYVTSERCVPDHKLIIGTRTIRSKWSTHDRSEASDWHTTSQKQVIGAWLISNKWSTHALPVASDWRTADHEQTIGAWAISIELSVYAGLAGRDGCMTDLYWVIGSWLFMTD